MSDSSQPSPNSELSDKFAAAKAFLAQRDRDAKFEASLGDLKRVVKRVQNSDLTRRQCEALDEQMRYLGTAIRQQWMAKIGSFKVGWGDE